MKRVLVVDDHQPWRRGIRAMLDGEPRWQIVGEAADGSEALRSVEALVPDLILLDVELPGLNGIEAAGRILSVTPAAKILFVSAHRSWDIAEAAFAAGARGYILKSSAGFELLPAMNAIVTGQRFVSGEFVGRDGAGHRIAADASSQRCHEASFYSAEPELLDTFTRFAEEALNDGKAVIMAAVEPRLAAVARRLRERLDLDEAIEERRYVPFDEADALSAVIVDGWPDEQRFWKSGTSMVLQAAGGSHGTRRVAACGACSDTLLHSGRLEAAIRLEQLWDELARVFNVDALCVYSTAALHEEEHRSALRRLSAEHSAVYSQ